MYNVKKEMWEDEHGAVIGGPVQWAPLDQTKWVGGIMWMGYAVLAK